MKTLKDQNLEKSLAYPQAKLVKELLAQHLGVEPEDINDDDSLSADLHMSTTDLVDFVESLSSQGIDTTPLDLINIETVGELVESLVSEEFL